MEFDYIKPTHTNPTQHLMLARLHHDDIQTLEDLFNSFNRITRLKTFPNKTHGFISFQTMSGATAALEYINNKDPIDFPTLPSGSTRPVASYSDIQQPKPQPPLPVAAVQTTEECGVPGLALYTEFITPEEEEAIIEVLAVNPWETLARRQVQHFGHTFSYIKRGVDTSIPTPPFPPIFTPLINRIQTLPGVDQPIDQCTANEYPLGVGLSPHVDTHSSFYNYLVSVSLAGEAVMTFRRGEEQRAIYLPRRSVLVMAGEARLAWEHGMPQRKTDWILHSSDDGGQGGVVEEVERTGRRVSLTFRAVRQGPCCCEFPESCDSQSGGAPPTRMSLKQKQQQQGLTEPQDRDRDGGVNDDDIDNSNNTTGGGSSFDNNEGVAPVLEEQHVSDVYDAIAPHFSATRFAIWPKVKLFIDSLPPGAIVADVGCGNGKYFTVRTDIFVAASDRSIGLVNVAARRLVPSVGTPAARADVLLADGLKLPYRTGSCDAALCIAVLHHMSTEIRRCALLAQIRDILRPGGQAIVTVWATEQENMKKVAKWQPLEGGDAADYLVPWHLPLHRAEAAAVAKNVAERTKSNSGSGSSRGMIDKQKGSVVFSRYYHLFEQEELNALVGKTGGLKLVESFYDKDNWCVVIEKL